MLPNVRANASILSVGCGPATIEREIGKADPSFTVTAVDASTERCAAARQTVRSSANVRVVQADALALPFPADSFDFVYTRFLLQHVGRPYDAIAEMVRVCRPGGKVLFHDLDGQLLWHFPESEEFAESIRVLPPPPRAWQRYGMWAFNPLTVWSTRTRGLSPIMPSLVLRTNKHARFGN